MQANRHEVISSTSPKCTTTSSVRSIKSENRINATDPLHALETRYSSPRARKNQGGKSSKKPIAPERSWDNYNDELAEKQCETYTQWLNYMFQSPEHWYEVEQSQRQEAGIPDDIDRPTLRTLLVHRRRAQATLRAVQFYNGPIMVSMKRSIFNEIITDKISLRSDQDVLSNVMLRGQLLDMLMSYSTPWLRLGLEIIFGEVISNTSSGNPLSPTKSNSKDILHSQKSCSLRAVLRQYINDRVLADPALLLKYTGGKCKVPSGRFEKMFKIELRRHTLGIVLILVVFLDAAKNNDLIESSPLLFNKNGIIKSTKAFLDVLCRDYLHGIGNLHKHLAQVGIYVSHEQTHIDEIDFHVSNLAIDLRDGVRLGKLAELLDKSVSVLEKMRLPAVSRLQKVHNVKVSLASLRCLKIPHIDQVHPNYIVDSHRPQVLKMLWHIMHSFQLPNLVDIERLKNEIYAIQRTRKFASKIINFSPVCGDITSCEDICDLLLVWCQVVCSCYNVLVTNFSSDFADGRALCFLIHHYHPSIMPKSDILPTKSCVKGIKSTPIVKNERQNFISANSKMIDIGGIPNILAIADSENIPDERTMIINIAYLCMRLLESSTEIRAASLIQKAFRRYRHTCLMKKLKAAVIIIEDYWTKQKDQYYRNRKAKFSDAVTSIERFFLAYRSKIISIRKDRLAAIQIQKVVRRFLVQRQYFLIKSILNSSATLIQSLWRSHRAHALFNQILRSTLIIQRFLRRTWIKYHQQLVTSSACSIQSIARCWFAKRYSDRLRHEQYFSKLESVVVICQSKVRRNLSRKIFLQKKDASIKIQSIARKYVACCHMRMLIASATKIQAIVRGYLVSLTFLQKHRIGPSLRTTESQIKAPETNISPIMNQIEKSSQRRIESDNRNQFQQIKAPETNVPPIMNQIEKSSQRHIESDNRNQFQKWKHVTQSFNTSVCHFNDQDSSAVLIQKIWRGFIQFHQYQFDLSDIVFVQSLLRRRICFTRFKCQRRSAIKIQALWRGLQIRKNCIYRNLRTQLDSKLAATIIQKYWRCYSASTDYTILLDATLTLQAFFRTQIERKRIAVASLQSTRAKEDPESTTCLAEHENENLDSRSGVNSDIFCRSSLQRPRNLEIQAVTEIQRLTRGFLVRIDLDIQHYAATEIQRWWRGNCAQLDFLILLDATRRIQQWFRCIRTSQCNLLNSLQSPRSDESMNLYISTTNDNDFKAQQRLSNQLDSSSRTNLFISTMIDNGFKAQQRLSNQLDSSSRTESTICSLINLKNDSDNICTSKTGHAVRTTQSFQEDICNALNSQTEVINSKETVNMIKTYSPESDHNAPEEVGDNFAKTCKSNIGSDTFTLSENRKPYKSLPKQSMLISPSYDCSLTNPKSVVTHVTYEPQQYERDILISVASEQSHFESDYLNINDYEHTHKDESVVNGSKRPTLEDEIREAKQISLLQKARLDEKMRRSDLLNRLRFKDQEKIIQPKDSILIGKSNKEATIQESRLPTKICEVKSPLNRSQKEVLLIEECIPSQVDPYNQYHLASDSSTQNNANKLSIRSDSKTCIMDEITSSSSHREEIQIDERHSDNYMQDSKVFESVHNTSVLDIVSAHVPVDYRRAPSNSTSAHVSVDYRRAPSNSTQLHKIRPAYEEQTSIYEHRRAIDIQRCWRGFHCRDKYEATRWGIILLQSHVRGHRVRETYRRIANSSSKFSSTHIEDESDPNLALGPRTSAALALLATSYDLAKIISAIKTLETSTRFSYSCCEAVVNKGSTSLLFRLIRYCNRSSPHIDLLKYVLKTLMNISKHTKLIDGVVCDRSVEILLDTIQMFRDKEKVLCLASSLLLMIVSTKNECLLECTKRENAKRIKGVFVLYKKKLAGAVGSCQKKLLSNEQYTAQKSLGAILKKMRDK